jgi:hypothetical protein
MWLLALVWVIEDDLVVSWAVYAGFLIRQERIPAEAAIRQKVLEAKEEAEQRREQAAHEPPRAERRREPSSLPTPPAVADEPIDFEDAFRLRTDPEYRKRALKWAEDEEARRVKDRRPREETPQQREAAAARRLKAARQLEAEGFPSNARVHYRVIVEKYPETQAAKEAARSLEPNKP